MAENEDGQEKTEDPSTRKLEQAREKGQVARSRELGSVVVMMFGAMGLIFFGGMLLDACREVFQLNFDVDREALMDPDVGMHKLLESAQRIIMALIPLFVVLALAATFIPPMVGGFNFSMQAVAPKLSKLNPLSGLKRMFSVQSLMELGKSLAKFFLVSTAAVLILNMYSERFLSLGFQDPVNAMAEGMSIVMWAFFLLCSSLILIAAVDVPFQLYQYNKQLMMTKQEVREEYKDTEGKPEVKSRIRAKQREMAQARMMQAVPTADVVITNPTHFAVALKYDPQKNLAPIVVAKGVDFIAEQIKKVAIANEVMILRAPPLARSIYYHTELEREIPQGLYIAVAQVLAYVFQLKRFHEGKGQNPGQQPEFPVPPDLKRD
jgi:flagellar biosynthetic protein FlhB